MGIDRRTAASQKFVILFDGLWLAAYADAGYPRLSTV